MRPSCTHRHGGLQGSGMPRSLPDTHPTIRNSNIGVCLWEEERGGEKKKSVQSLIANCLRDHRATQALCVGDFFFSPCLPSLSPTSQHLRWGLPPRFAPRVRPKTGSQAGVGRRMLRWELGTTGTPSPQEATGGSCGSAQGCQSRWGEEWAENIL